MATLTLKKGTQVITYPVMDKRPWPQTLNSETEFTITRETKTSIYLTLGVPYMNNLNDCRVAKKDIE